MSMHLTENTQQRLSDKSEGTRDENLVRSISTLCWLCRITVEIPGRLKNGQKSHFHGLKLINGE